MARPGRVGNTRRSPLSITGSSRVHPTVAHRKQQEAPRENRRVSRTVLRGTPGRANRLTNGPVSMPLPRSRIDERRTSVRRTRTPNAGEETAPASGRTARRADRAAEVSRGRTTPGRAQGRRDSTPQAGDLRSPAGWRVPGKARTVPARMGWVNESGKQEPSLMNGLQQLKQHELNLDFAGAQRTQSGSG